MLFRSGLDVMADLAALFAGYKFDRTLNPYIFGGIGANYAFNNDEANAVKDLFPSQSGENYLCRIKIGRLDFVNCYLGMSIRMKNFNVRKQNNL